MSKLSMKTIPITTNPTQEQIQAKINDVTSRITAALRDYQRGGSVNDYEKALKQLQRELEGLERKRVQIFSTSNSKAFSAAIGVIQTRLERLSNN